MSSLFTRTNIIIFYFLLSAYLAHFYIHDGISMGKDGGAIFLISTDSVLSEYAYTWAEDIHGEHRRFDYLYAPFYFILSLFQVFGVAGAAFAYWTAAFFLALSGTFLLCGKAIEIFDLKVKEKNLACFLVSLVYLLSPIAVVYRWGDVNTQAFVYGVFTLFVFFILDIFFEKDTRKALGKAAAYTLAMSFLGLGFINVALLLAPAFVLLFRIDRLQIRKSIIVGILLILFLSWTILGFFSSNFNDPDTKHFKGFSTGSSRVVWAYSHYYSTISEIYVYLFYPMDLYGGIQAAGGHYMNPVTFAIWAIFVLAILLITLIFWKQFSDQRYLLFSVALFLVGAHLTMMPKGALEIIYHQFIYSDILWQLKSAYDRFSFLLQFSLVFLSLNYVVFFLRQESKTIKRAGIGFLVLTLFVAGLPLLNGETAYGALPGVSTKSTPGQEVLGFHSYMEDNADMESWTFHIPAVRGAWMRTKWYVGDGYQRHLKGKNTGSLVSNSQISEDIVDILETGDFILDEGKQEKVMELLRLGNYRHIVIRGDMELSNQDEWPRNPGIRNQFMNTGHLVERYNLTKVFSNGEICRARALMTEDIAQVLIDMDDEPAQINAEMTFRRLSLGKAGMFYLRISNTTIIYAHGKGRFLMTRRGNETKSYWTDHMPNKDLDWHNVSLALDEEPHVLVDGEEINVYEHDIPDSRDVFEMDASGMLISKIRIEGCNDGTCEGFSADYEKDPPGILGGHIFEGVDCLSDDYIGYEVYENPEVIGNVFLVDASGGLAGIEYEAVDPATYLIEQGRGIDDTIVLSETRDPGWEAKFYKDGNEILKAHSSSYKGLTAFQIDQDVDYDSITIRYKPQDFAEWGARISILSWAAVSLVLVFWKPSKKEEH